MWKIEDLSPKQERMIRASTKKRGQKPPALSLEEVMIAAIDAKTDLPTPEREIPFHPERKWRLDLGWPGLSLAIEIHGGVSEHNRGRHLRPEGFTKDREKMNEAQLAGWLVLEFTSGDMKTRIGYVLDAIERAYAKRSS